jgi:hypothetical protein
MSDYCDTCKKLYANIYAHLHTAKHLKAAEVVEKAAEVEKVEKPNDKK